MWIKILKELRINLYFIVHFPKLHILENSLLCDKRVSGQ